MVKIKPAFICPRCDEGITATSKPEHCPSCGLKFSDVSNGFVTPITIAEQQERINDKDKHAKFILALPVDTATNILNDALHIIQTIPGKKVRASDIRDLMGMAIQIGDVAKKYEDFLAAGGVHTPGLFIKTKTTTGDGNELQKTTNGGTTPASVATPMLAPVEPDGGSRG